VRYLQRYLAIASHSRGPDHSRWRESRPASSCWRRPHGRARGLETAGVVFALVAALAIALFVLLTGVFSLLTTVSTMGVVLGSRRWWWCWP